MSAPKVLIEAPSRLHFGMLSFGQPGVRQFGGVGVMVNQPGFVLRMVKSARIEVTGPLAERAATFAQRGVEALCLPGDAGCRIEIESAPREHVGLGTGTQLGLAIAAGIHALYLSPAVVERKAAFGNLESISKIVGRAERSSIGTHGFARGGLLVEAGKRAAGELAPLVARLELPGAWRFLLLIPKTAVGRFGDAEREAFTRIPPIPRSVTEWLAHEIVMNLLPAVVEGDFVSFSRSLGRYGELAGSCFASEQFGAFHDKQTADLVAHIRRLGAEGVGQSSWGPTLYVAVRDEAEGRNLAARLASAVDVTQYDCLIAEPNRHGAHVGLGAIDDDEASPRSFPRVELL